MATGKKYYWIKLRKDFMTGDIVDFLMSQKNGSQYVVLYQMLCLMCINTKGALTRKIGEVIVPFDVDKIQRDCKYFSRDTVTIALGLFKKLGLVYEEEPGCLVISDFDSLIGSESDYARQKRLQRQNEHICRQNGCIAMDNSVDSHVDSSADSNADSSADNYADSGVDNVHMNVSSLSTQSKSIEKDIITISNEIVCQTDVRRIAEAWNGLQCLGIKPVSKLDSTSKRYGLLVARIKQYGINEVLAAVEKIKSSDFLQGKSSNGWTITFDWFVRPNNFPKVLEGNYDNKSSEESMQTKNANQGRNTDRSNKFNNFPQRAYDMGNLERGLLADAGAQMDGQGAGDTIGGTDKCQR